MKTRMAQVKVSRNYETTERDETSDKNTIIDVDDDDWSDLNIQYYKLRQIEYDGFQLPIFKEFRQRANAVRNTVEFQTMEFHW